MIPTDQHHDPWARSMRDAMTPVRTLEPTEAEIQRALSAARTETAPRLRIPRITTSATVAVSLVGAVALVPATRATVTTAYGTLSEWVSGTGTGEPGRAVTADDDAPDWITATRGSKRLVASSNGASLYAVRDGDSISFAIGGGVGIGTTIDDWRERFRSDKIVPLGPGNFGNGPNGPVLDRRQRRALMGVTAKVVDRVALTYTVGPPTVVKNVRDGFVLLADATRRPSELIAYGQDGNVVEARDASNFDLRVCRYEQGCPPGPMEPDVVYDPEIDPNAPFFPKLR